MKIENSKVNIHMYFVISIWSKLIILALSRPSSYWGIMWQAFSGRSCNYSQMMSFWFKWPCPFCWHVWGQVGGWTKPVRMTRNGGGPAWRWDRSIDRLRDPQSPPAKKQAPPQGTRIPYNPHPTPLDIIPMIIIVIVQNPVEFDRSYPMGSSLY